jgi:hypothetical protein
MKRVVLMALSVVLALALAAPVVSAQPNKGASGGASGTIVINPGDYPGSCDFPFSLDHALPRNVLDVAAAKNANTITPEPQRYGPRLACRTSTGTAKPRRGSR